MSILMMGCDPELWGFIPSFLHEDDKRPAKEQFNDRYVAGWQSFEGFKLDKTNMYLSYPGDPPTKPLGYMFFRDEIIVLYEHAWVMILNCGGGEWDGKWEVCRMD